MKISPDGERYLAMGRGERVHLPFHLRWLWPWLCRDVLWRWRALQAFALVGLPVSTYWWLDSLGFPWEWCLAGAVIAATTWPIAGFAWTYPVLVDTPSIVLVIGAAIAYEHDLLWLCVVIGVLAAMAWEKAPFVLALMVWHPGLESTLNTMDALMVLLAGALVVLVRRVGFRHQPVVPEQTVITVERTDQFQVGQHVRLENERSGTIVAILDYRAVKVELDTPEVIGQQVPAKVGDLWDPRLSLLPWGVMLAAFFEPLDSYFAWLPAIALGWLSVLVIGLYTDPGAHVLGLWRKGTWDLGRVLLAAWPPVLAAALMVIPLAWLVPAVVLHYTNLYGRNPWWVSSSAPAGPK